MTLFSVAQKPVPYCLLKRLREKNHQYLIPAEKLALSSSFQFIAFIKY